MRVLMVTREGSEDRRYGLGRSLAPLFAPMNARGVDVRYFCQEDLPAGSLAARQRWVDRCMPLLPARDRDARLNLLRAWLERMQVGLAAARLASREGFTHVHAHDPWLAAGVALGLALRLRGKIRWGFTQHGFGSYSRATHDDGLVQGPRMQRWLRRIERGIAARARWVIAPTSAALDRVGRDLGVATRPAHWHCVPHARPSLAPASPAERAPAREALGLAADDVLVLGVGRLVPLKRFDRVIRACARQQGTRVHLLLLGTGDAAPLERVAGETGFAGRLRMQATDDVTPYFHAADIYMSASSTESFGIANLEALCAGLPAICSAVGGVPEVVGEAAWLVDGETDTLAAALGELLGDASARAAWSARALERARTWPDAQQIADRYVAIYQAA